MRDAVMPNIPETLYKKILLFMEETDVEPEYFHQQVLLSLEKIFGYHKLLFFSFDSMGKTLDYSLLNISRRVQEEYKNYYADIDIFAPKNALKLTPSKNVISLTDVMPFKEKQLSMFYKDFLLKNGFCSGAATYLQKNGSLLGLLGVWQPKNKKTFCDTDKMVLNIIGKYITRVLASNTLLADIEYQKNIFEAHANYSPAGLMVINRSLQLLYFNQSAREICVELMGNVNCYNPLEQFINLFIANTVGWKSGFTKSVLSPSLKHLTIHVVSSIHHVYGKNLYAVYLIPKNKTKIEQNFEHYSGIYNLTFREREVLELVIRGLGNQAISAELFISVSTVKRHIQNIFKKMEVKNRANLFNKFGHLNMP